MKTIYAYWVALTIALVACTENEKNQLSDLPIVAHQVEVDGQEMTVCELDLLKDTIDLPLSYWVEDLEAVKLDGKDEALVGQGPVYVSDNYILVGRANNVPCKLFRRDGSFVGKVGSLGQGPGEYTNVCDMQIDEQAEHIYLLPFRSKAIYVYDLKGNYQKDIPLNKKYEKMMVPKGLFKVDAAKNRVAVMTLPFDYLPLVAWVQDMEGSFLHEVPMNHLKIRPAFSNEMLSSKCFADALDVSLYTLKEVRKDTLYHLDMNDGKLYPKFTLDFGGRDITRHNYFDFSTHYAGSLAAIEQVGENSFMVNATCAYLVKKESGKGAFFRTTNDFLDNEPINIISKRCINGYYTLNIEPAALIEKLEKGLKNHPDEARRKKMEALMKTIDEDDNNYIFIGKLKTEFGNTVEK